MTTRNPRLESGLECIIYAEFARQQHAGRVFSWYLVSPQPRSVLGFRIWVDGVGLRSQGSWRGPGFSNSNARKFSDRLSQGQSTPSCLSLENASAKGATPLRARIVAQQGQSSGSGQPHESTQTNRINPFTRVCMA